MSVSLAKTATAAEDEAAADRRGGGPEPTQAEHDQAHARWGWAVGAAPVPADQAARVAAATAARRARQAAEHGE